MEQLDFGGHVLVQLCPRFGDVSRKVCAEGVCVVPGTHQKRRLAVSFCFWQFVLLLEDYAVGGLYLEGLKLLVVE